MIRALDFAAPFFQVEYVTNEPSYRVEEASVLINLDRKGGSSFRLNTMSVAPLRSVVAEHATVEDLTKVLVVKNYMKYDFQDPANRELMVNTWKSLYQWSGREVQKGIPYHKTAKEWLEEDIAVTVCYAAPQSPSGPHKEHAVELDEVHAQIQGVGRVQCFRENDTSTKYQDLFLAPGTCHDLIFDEKGEYPWHQYNSVTACVYIPVEIVR